MPTSTLTSIFADVFLLYTFASVYYVLATRCMGTPFRDSLSATQRSIKRRESKKRANVFVAGLVVGGLGMLVVRNINN